MPNKITLEHGMMFNIDEIDESMIDKPLEHLKQMNIQSMWDKGYQGEGITIAILDSGCDINHPYLKDKIVHKYNLTKDDDTDRDNVTDYIGHGTHIASLIVSDNYNGVIAGVSPKANLLIYKVIDKDAIADYNVVAQGVYAAAQRGADIINVSLGGSEPAPQIHEAIKSALRMGCLVVCASGNEGDGNEETVELLYPGCYQECVQVGAMDNDYAITNFSNTNQFIDCVANGNALLGFVKDNKIMALSGTSQSVPLVCGALALLKEYGRKELSKELNAYELYDLLLKNTKSIPNVSENQQGHGYVYFKEGV